MNKSEKKLLSKGENLYFEGNDGFYQVSAEPVSADLNEFLKKESEDSKKLQEEEEMKKSESLPKKNSEEKVLEEESQELKDVPVLEEVPREEELPSETTPEWEEVPEEYHDDFQDGLPEENPEDLPADDFEEVEPEDSDDPEDYEESEVFEESEEPEEIPAAASTPEEPREEKPRKPKENRVNGFLSRANDPCPGVSAREHWAILRNRFFVLLALILVLVVLVAVFFIGTNRGAVAFAPKEAISEEVIAAKHELPLRVAYYTGGENSWKTVDRWNFSLSKDSPVVWVYLRGGVPYYDEECRNKIPFSGDNMGNLKNANSSLGPVSLAEDGVTWTVDKTGEKVAFLSGLQQDLSREVASFTAGGAKELAFSEVISEGADTASYTEAVVLPIYPSNALIYYNDGRGWKTLHVDVWDGDTSRFEFWNFGYKDSSLRYWDAEMKEQVSPSSSDSGNYFWTKDSSGKPQKAKWNGSAVEPL